MTIRPFYYLLVLCCCPMFHVAAQQVDSVEDTAMFDLYLFEANDAILSSFFGSNLNQGDSTFALPALTNLSQSTIDQKWYRTDTGKTLVASGMLMGLGLYTYKDNGFMNRVGIKEGINRFLPDYSNTIDDYTQYIPYAAVYALDALGIESKHSAWRKTTTIATGAGTALLIVSGMKYGIGETRPDGSANNSFPSGHTTTAFMGAHIFHKEYGHRSVYYSIGSYLLATVTGALRQLNDRHWVSDVMFGAGLGLSIAEFSYFVNDRIHGDNGINEIEIAKKEPNYLRPSYLGIKMGYAGLTESFTPPGAGFEAKNGFYLAVDGAWFFSKNFGVGGEIGFQSFPIEVNQAIQDEIAAEGYEFAFQPVGSSKNLIGPQVQLTGRKSMLGAKLLFGTSRIADTEVFLQDIVADGPTEEDDIIFASVRPVANFAWSGGIYYRKLIDQRLALNLYVDYNSTDLKSTLTRIEDFNPGLPSFYFEEPLRGKFNSISAGISFTVMLW